MAGMNPIKRVHIFGGGTVSHISNHFSVCAPAFGSTAHDLMLYCGERFTECEIEQELTCMAGGTMRTNADVATRIEQLKADPLTKVIFMSAALCDWEPQSMHSYLYSDGYKHLDDGGVTHEFGKHVHRLETRKVAGIEVHFRPATKIISSIRTGRKDIFLVGFKVTCGASRQEMYEKGLRLCKEGSCNLVVVNDVKTRFGAVISPEEAAYPVQPDGTHGTYDRAELLREVVDMTWYRSQLTFTQSTVIDGKPVAWDDLRVPSSLRAVVNHLIAGRAYKVFNGGSVGHFAARLSDTEFLTSIRKTDFNRLAEIGLVYVRTDGPDTVLAYGAKPSVGGQSQRIVFKDHPGFDCIAHAHVPLRPNHPDDIPVRSQREIECGSTACGRNVSDHLRQFGNLKAVYLDQHGPNIVFPSSIDPQEVIDFIERNFDLSKKTGGYQL